MGTTAVAAFHSKRSCIGIEVKHEYIEMARQRVLKECGVTVADDDPVSIG